MQELNDIFIDFRISITEEKNTEINKIRENNQIQEIANLYKEHNDMIKTIKQCYELYFTHGARSSKKTDCLHNFIKSIIDSVILEKN